MLPVRLQVVWLWFVEAGSYISYLRRCAMYCVSFINLVIEDFVMSFVVFRIALRIEFGFGIFPAVWHTVVWT